MLPLFLSCSNAAAPADDTWRLDTAPPGGDTDSTVRAEGVVLNELLADNQSGITSELGAREDWIELHNSSSEAIDLTGWSLSDDAEEPWRLTPSQTLEPGAFLLIWCDDPDRDDPDRDDLTDPHASFKLDRDGESIVLQDGQGETVDAVTYPMLAPDQSWGRPLDGGQEWAYTVEPTPGANNL
ncbi:MAG: lamin tail domain-containing protein [Myxococcota bacterium]|nr:lamin tail domain-containing protein [Myxococcota bacterium]